MAPKLGDTVFVNETDVNTDTDLSSVGLVVHVYSEDDSNGDGTWWDRVSEKELCDVVVFRRDGSSDTITASKSETYTDDEGRERKRPGTYETSADAATTVPESQSATVLDPGTTDPRTAEPGAPVTAADTQSGDGTVAATSGAQTATAGAGWFPGPGNGGQ